MLKLIVYWCPQCDREVEVPPFARHTTVSVYCRQHDRPIRCYKKDMEPRPPARPLVLKGGTLGVATEPEPD